MYTEQYLKDITQADKNLRALGCPVSNITLELMVAYNNSGQSNEEILQDIVEQGCPYAN